MPGAGPLALVGGSEWTPGCDFDAELLEASGSSEVLVIPAAAAFEHPERSVERASRWFAELGGKAVGLPVLNRDDAENADLASQVSQSRFIYIADGSALHLRSVLKNSQVWAAIEQAWRSGAVVAGSSAGATLLGDPMVDPRGGAFTLGLGLVRKLAVVPQWDRWTDYKASRMGHLAPSATIVAEVQERTALIRWSDGTWQSQGAGKIALGLDKKSVDLDAIEPTVEIG